MKVLLLVVVLLNPAGEYRSIASVVKQCPPKEIVLADLQKRVSSGELMGYWATCNPILINNRQGGA